MVADDGVACVIVGGEAGSRAGPTSRSGIIDDDVQWLRAGDPNWWTGDLISLTLWRPLLSDVGRPTDSPFSFTMANGLKLISFATFGAIVVTGCWFCIFRGLLQSDMFRLLFFCASAWIKWCELLNCPLATFTAFDDCAFNAADDGSKSVPAFEVFKGLKKSKI